jgi:hypothetical protein
MPIWHYFELIVGHDGVRLAIRAVAIKLFFKQFVDGFIDIERWRTGPADF